MPSAKVEHDPPVATGALVLICLALAWLPTDYPLAFERSAILAGDAWRLWTGHLLHFSADHLGLDSAMLLLAGTLAERELGSRSVAALLLLGMPLLALGLLVLLPDLLQYRGASGLVMMLALAGATVLWRRQAAARLALTLLGLGLAVKIALDATGALHGLGALPPDVTVVWQAHLLGAALGWLFAWRHPSARAGADHAQPPS